MVCAEAEPAAGSLFLDPSWEERCLRSPPTSRPDRLRDAQPGHALRQPEPRARRGVGALCRGPDGSARHQVHTASAVGHGLRTPGSRRCPILLSEGQASTGWHPIQNEESSRTPLAFIGPGIAAGRTIPYAESIDIVPTVLDLLGTPPINADGDAGRVLHEIEPGERPAPAVLRRIVELNRQHVDHIRLTARMQLLASRHPLIDTSLMRAASRPQRQEVHSETRSGWTSGARNRQH